MDPIVDYERGVDPRCGKEVDVYKDILITPFYTKEYCDSLVEYCKKLDGFFQLTGDYGDDYSNRSMFMNMFSRIWYWKYSVHCKEYLKPAVDKEYWEHSYTGVFPPFINKFSLTEKNQTDMPLHCEVSGISIVVKLNDDYEGGDLIFPRQQIGNKDFPVGTAFVFPGWATHPHYVSKLTGGNTRYSLVGFSTPPKWVEEETDVIQF